MRALFSILLIAVAAPNREDPTPKEKPPVPQQQILGDWQLVKLSLGPGSVPQDRTTFNQVFRITPTETVFMVNGEPSVGDGLTAMYTLDPSKNPMTIDFTPKQRGGKMPGILKLEGDQLILGLTTGGEVRPADFGNAQMTAYYKRVQK